MSFIQIQGSDKTQPPIVGIDLGTTNSLVAFTKNGEPRVLSSREGQHLVPSVVSFEEGKTLIGYAAKNKKVNDAQHTIFSVKRLLGRGFEDLKAVAGNLPYTIVPAGEAKDGIVRIQIEGKTYTAVEISALILKELKTAAEAALGVPVNRAVITVPAYFNDSQRQATRAAGRLAGLDVLRIVNEPTAAALAYGLAQKQQGTIAVYDLGGGTFDISILKLHDGVFEVVATHGDTALGGDDMDQAISDEFVRELHEQGARVDFTLPAVKAVLNEAAEKLKIDLSEQREALVDFVLPPEAESSNVPYRRTWSRNEFETCIAPVLERTREPCLNALSDAGLKTEDLTDVVLVGGPTRLAAVQKMAESIFKRTPNTSMHPDEVVALGAAIQADILAGNNKDFLLLDVVPLSLGLETYGGLMAPLIPRNTRIPTAAREIFTTFADNQTGVDIHVLQGERERIEDNRSLARFKLAGIQPMPARMPRVEVLFLIDADGILQVAAKDLLSGREQSIEVRPTHGLTDSEIENMLVSSAENAEEDIEYRQLVETRNHAAPLLRTAEKKLPDAFRLLPRADALAVEAGIQLLKTALGGKDIAAIQSASRKLDLATVQLADLLVSEAVTSTTTQAASPTVDKKSWKITLGEKILDAEEGETILDVALRNHIELPHACGGFGACSACHVVVKAGEENLSKMDDREEERLERAQGLTLHSRLGCRAMIRGDVAITIPD